MPLPPVPHDRARPARARGAAAHPPAARVPGPLPRDAGDERRHVPVRGPAAHRGERPEAAPHPSGSKGRATACGRSTAGRCCWPSPTGATTSSAADAAARQRRPSRRSTPSPTIPVAQRPPPGRAQGGQPPAAQPGGAELDRDRPRDDEPRSDGERAPVPPALRRAPRRVDGREHHAHGQPRADRPPAGGERLEVRSREEQPPQSAHPDECRPANARVQLRGRERATAPR